MLDILKKIGKRFKGFLTTIVMAPIVLIGTIKSRQIQSAVFEQSGYNRSPSIIVFFIPGTQRVTGGVLQIFTLNRLTREYYKNADIDSILCWLPETGKHFYRFEGFNNSETIFSIDMLLKKCAKNSKILFHVPEYTAEVFFNYLGEKRLKQLRIENKLRVNILNQNIDVMVSPTYIKRLKKIFPDITITAGNPAWASEAERLRMACPIYPLPTWYYPDDAPWQPYESKKNLLIVSPDPDSNRDAVLTAIRTALPDIRIVVIQGIKYEQYLQYEKDARWSLTFGEGMDGYFYGPVLRGGIAFAVRNGTFEHPGMSNLQTIYANYDEMINHIVVDMKYLDNKTNYEKYNESVRIPISNVFGRNQTLSGLESFYNDIDFNCSQHPQE